MSGHITESQSGADRQPRTVVIGTAGHIDHGKTALIRSLTGVDTDRLPEEKRRGITIDLGFASLESVASDGSPLRLSFIDVPGHARFVRNMLAGTGGIDAALLVISAEEGVKPQTEEHLAICSVLGIRRGLTVLTKIDAVDESRLQDVRNGVRRFLSTSFLASQPVVCVSAFTGAGMDVLRRELSALASQIPARDTIALTRLPLDRAFASKGFGTVITGTLISGAVAAGQELAVQPGGRVVKVRGMQMHGQPAKEAKAAARVALNLSRIDAPELQRGDTLVEPSTVIAVDTVDAEIQMIESAPALRHRARVHFHAFASECMATVTLYDSHPIAAKTTGLVRVRLSKPIVLLPGDRFVLRQGAPITTVGGGRVLDAHPLPRLNKARSKDWLQRVRAADSVQQLELRIARRGTAGLDLSRLSTETGWKTDAIRAFLASPLREESVQLLEERLLITREALQQALAIVSRQLEALSRQANSAEVKRSVLRSQLTLCPQVVDWTLRTLQREDKLQVRSELLILPHKGGDQQAGDRQRISAICSIYEQAGLAPPLPGDIAARLSIDATELRRFITILLREKKLVRLGDDALCMHHNPLAELKRNVQALRGQSIDVAQFKRLTGLSRKYAIPLLEYLDQERITRKQGDQRIVL